MRIGELAQAAGVDSSTIRYYEQAGLLAAPARRDNNYRRYDAAALERLRFIGQCRALDMSLAEIGELLAHGQAADGHGHHRADEVIHTHLRHVRERLAQLQALEQRLVALQQSCHDGQAAACGVVQALAQPLAATATAATAGSGGAAAQGAGAALAASHAATHTHAPNRRGRPAR